MSTDNSGHTDHIHHFVRDHCCPISLVYLLLIDMKPIWSESRFIVPVMALIAILLLLCVPIKLGVVSLSYLEAKKELIDTLSTIFGCVILSFGAVFSYIRFFKGRMLKPKIDLKLQNVLLPQDEKNLHWIEIAIENKGNVAVWNYTLKLLATPHPGDESPIDVSNYISIPKIDDSEYLVDVGETAFEYAIIELNKEPYAYTIEAILKDKRGTQWRRCITVSNKESGSN